MYVEDKGSRRPDLWRPKMSPKEDIDEDTSSNEQNRPIIYIINTDNGRSEKGRRYYGGGGLFGGLYRFIYVVRSLFTFCLVGMVVFIVIVIIMRPDIVYNLFINILKKIGLYNIFMQVRGLIGR